MFPVGHYCQGSRSSPQGCLLPCPDVGDASIPEWSVKLRGENEIPHHVGRLTAVFCSLCLNLHCAITHPSRFRSKRARP